MKVDRRRGADRSVPARVAAAVVVCAGFLFGGVAAALTVEITATDNIAEEIGPSPGNFQVSRDGSEGPLEVRISLDPASGAVAGVDFSLGGVMLAGGAGTVTIPDGESFVDIPLNPVDDIAAEASESVILQVVADPAYSVGGSASATVTIRRNDFVVTNTGDFASDAGAAVREGTLRQALENASSLPVPPDITPPGKTVTFSDSGGVPFSTEPQTIRLAGRELTLNRSADIVGPAAPGGVTVDAGGESALISIFASSTECSVSRLTLTGGSSRSRAGGPIEIERGAEVTMVECVIEGNRGDHGGGAFHVFGAALNLVDSIVRDNRTDGDGGGIMAVRGEIEIRGSTIANNECEGRGGGIQFNSGGSLSILHSTLSGNRSGGSGGAIDLDLPNSLTIDHATITGNHADTDRSGGALDVGGALAGDRIRNRPVLSHSIIAGNFIDGETPTPDDIRIDTAISGASRYNLIGVDTGVGGIVNGTGGNQIGTAASPIDPMLGSLAFNGGPTPTHELLPGSPALDAGNPGFFPSSYLPPRDFDQRGSPFVRVAMGRIDIGAFERLSSLRLEMFSRQSIVRGGEGEEFTSDGSFFDAPGETVTVSADVGVVSQSGTDEGDWTWSHVPAEGPEQSTVTITATNSLNVQRTASFEMHVSNVAPVVVLDPVAGIDEDGIATLTGTVSDPGTLDSFTLDIDWGDPSSPDNTEQVMLPASAGGSQAFMLTHRYLDDNPTGTARDSYTIEVAVTDDDAATGSDTTTVMVSNVRPELVLDPVAPIDQSGVATLTGRIVDPGTLDTFTVFVDWGDPLSPDNFESFDFPSSVDGNQAIELTHLYVADGPGGIPGVGKVIFALVLDDEGASDSASSEVVVGPPPAPGGIDEVVRLPDGSVRIGFAVVPGEDYRIEYSDDLVHWIVVVDGIIDDGTRVQWTDPEAGLVPKRFYRYVRIGEAPPPGG
jgi:hypothetical protein